MEPQGKNVLWIVGATAFIVGLAAGYWAGNTTGMRAGEARLKPVVDLAFPPPPDEMYALTGVVKSIYGTSITLEIDDPDDYLPHADGSPRRKQTRTVSVSSATTFSDVNFRSLDREGNPVRTSFAFTDLQPGNTISVRSASNIRRAESFDAISVERFSY